jgi:hypothetical protein
VRLFEKLGRRRQLFKRFVLIQTMNFAHIKPEGQARGDDGVSRPITIPVRRCEDFDPQVFRAQPPARGVKFD